MTDHPPEPTSPAQHAYDLAVIGGGIVGLATAREALRRRPDLRVIVLEKEPSLGAHQTGHNSGVLHAGIYYKPGSLKAQACAAGRTEMVEYCDAHGIPYELCGKLIVALDEGELPRLEELHRRGVANGVPGLVRVEPDELREIEPHCEGIAALWSPQTGIIDFSRVADSYAREVSAAGGEIACGQRVTALAEHGSETVIRTAAGAEIAARVVIACAGLHADRVAKMGGAAKSDTQIVPFRGDYYTFKPEKRHLVRGLIYPVPNPGFPFLGVHFTRVMNGEVIAGPNAVLAFAREGYRRRDVNVRDLAEALAFPGFWKLALKHWRMGLGEMLRDYMKGRYVRELQRYLPELRGEDLTFGPSGVRAQALDADGGLVDDFLITSRGSVVHVQNAPSPAATSSLVISRLIVDEVETRVGL